MLYSPMTWLTGESGNKTLVTYSIGNLLSTMLHIYNNVGGILSFDVVKDKSGNVYIDAPYFLPVVCHYTADTSVVDSRGMQPAPGFLSICLGLYERACIKSRFKSL